MTIDCCDVTLPYVYLPSSTHLFLQFALDGHVECEDDDVAGDLPRLAGEVLPPESGRSRAGVRVDPAPAGLVRVLVATEHAHRQRSHRYDACKSSSRQTSAYSKRVPRTNCAL